ncbi:MAG: zinc ribbon domain-containing protein [Egibacteraceae bacterium]
MIPATPAEQRRLLDLQRADTTIRQLEHRRAHLPEQQSLDANADTLGKVRGEHVTAREQLERLAGQQRRHEQEIATVNVRRKSEEGRMYSGQIRNSKELEALRHELTDLRTRKNELEDALLEIMEQVEELDELTATLTQRESELDTQAAELTAARDHAATDIDGELVRLRGERESLAADLSDEVLGYYDELRQRKDGVAVAELQGRTCAGCRLELTAIELEEVGANAKEGLARCEQCGRILVPV